MNRIVIYIALACGIIGFAVFIIKRNEPPMPDVRPLLETVPNSSLLLQFNEALKAGDKKALKVVLEAMDSPDPNQFLRVFSSGEIMQMFGVANYKGTHRLALELRMRYGTPFNDRKIANVLVVLKLRDSDWMVEWWFLGAAPSGRPLTSQPSPGDPAHG